ncbi:PucR family transcriptional regulator [Rhodococcus sp. ACS1]|uniref:PucR family transcriptional regulator n=1 Tax=Rhodococcus TaxID=1827 RepID=UPI000BB11AB6|nr:helix-turn-helix domain-containing protein [Rhodococcus sp. ACS1]PBC48286.1 PucR family transcriptional regulator [Rhodococcus sp. ACS1]
MPHWTHELAGTRARQSEREWLSPDADRIRSTLGDGAVTWAVEVGEDIATRISREMPILREGASQPSAVRRATTSTALRALTLVAGLGEPDTSLASAEVEEVAVDFARRGLELNDLLGSIRVGYAVLAAAILDAALRLIPPAESSAELRRVSVLLFEVLDQFTGVAATTFLEERSAWAAGVSAARLDFVKKIVEAEPVDPSRADEVLGYPLGGHHLAIIAWSGPHAGHDLRSIVDPVLRHWGIPTATLVIPVGLQTIWAWGAVSPDQGHVLRGPLPEFGDISVVVGQLGSGVDGFRRSHMEARAVERIVRLRADQPRTTCTHEDFALEVLLLAEPDAAAGFASRLLGPLADDDARTADLRSTLIRYLDMDHSLAKVAAAEHISKNTVTYRVHKALSLCEHPPGASTTNLRAALRVHEWLRGGTTSRPDA